MNKNRRIVTYTMVQTMLDCYTHSQHDSQMVQAVATEAGLYPLAEADRKIIAEHLGEDVLARFLEACGCESGQNDLAQTRRAGD